MSDTYVNHIWGWGRKKADALIAVSLGSGPDYCNASTTLIFGSF